MSEFGKKSYIIDRPEPPKVLEEARFFAMKTINELMETYPKFSADGRQQMRWIKTNWTYPSFEHFTFGYKNQVYPVFVELIENGRSLMEDNEIGRFLDAADKYNLVPCTFKVDISHGYRAISGGWNLWDLRTEELFDPIALADDENVKMSEWELLDFSIQIVRNYLEKNGMELMSYCNLPEINPQLWFKDKQGNVCWMVVRHISDLSDEDYHRWVGLEKTAPVLTHYDGYFAGVSFVSAEPFLTDENGNLIPFSERGKNDPLYRGDKITARFTGIKRIFVSSI